MDPHIEASIYVLRHDEGGRRHGVFSGYRPSFRHNNQYNDVSLEILEGDSLAGGKHGNVRLTFLVPRFQERRLFVGLEFDLTEGARAVCHGRITKVLDDTMVAAPPTL